MNRKQLDEAIAYVASMRYATLLTTPRTDDGKGAKADMIDRLTTIQEVITWARNHWNEHQPKQQPLPLPQNQPPAQPPST